MLPWRRAGGCGSGLTHQPGSGPARLLRAATVALAVIAAAGERAGGAEPREDQNYPLQAHPRGASQQTRVLTPLGDALGAPLAPRAPPWAGFPQPAPNLFQVDGAS